MESDTTEPGYYATLGLDRSCTSAQIRTAYRLLAKQHHPDVNRSSPTASVQTRALNAAYEVLSDPARRRAYDRELHAAQSSPPGRIKRDISQDVSLQIDVFFRGATLEVRVTDPALGGKVESYALAVPPETAPGARFRIARTKPAEGGVVQVRVRPRPSARFKVRGSDLRCDLRINAQRALEGGTEWVTGAAGARLSVKIPPRVRRGEILRVAGAGLPKPRGGRGDLLVRVTYRPEVRVSRARRF